MSDHNYLTFRFAALGRRQLTCEHNGRVQVLYPHIVGHRFGREAAVCFACDDENPSNGHWLMLSISEISNVLSRGGAWCAGNPATLPRNFIDAVDVEVDVAPVAEAPEKAKISWGIEVPQLAPSLENA